MKKYFTGIFATCLLLTACEKKTDPIDTFYVTVDYKQVSPKDVSGNVELNPKDSMYLNFTISSPDDMSYIEIQKNGVRIDTFQLINTANKKSFSGIKGYRVDSVAGEYTYRVLARNARAIYMGDGGKQIKVTVKPDFDFWSYRILAVPDSVNKTNKCYFSSVTGKTFSYSDGGVNSGTIDFGYYYDTTTANKHTIYALNTAQTQLGFYDISAWAKNATVFKKMATSVNFVTGITSSGAINTLIKNNMTSGTSSKVTLLSTTPTGSTSNSVIGFRTAAGKYGVILVRYLNRESAANGTFIEVDVKVQK